MALFRPFKEDRRWPSLVLSRKITVERFLFPRLSPPRRVMSLALCPRVVSQADFTLLPMRSRKMLARDVSDGFATRSGRVYDVTDTDNRLLGTKWQLALTGVYSRFSDVGF